MFYPYGKCVYKYNLNEHTLSQSTNADSLPLTRLFHILIAYGKKKDVWQFMVQSVHAWSNLSESLSACMRCRVPGEADPDPNGSSHEG